MDKTIEIPNDVNDGNRDVLNENEEDEEIHSMYAVVSIDDDVVQYLLYNGRAFYPRDNDTEEQAPLSPSSTEEQVTEERIPEKCCDMPTYTSIWIPD